MITDLNDPALATDAEDLLRRADRVEGSGLLKVEFNFPAGILTACDIHTSMGAWGRAAQTVERYAELTMLQLALINEGWAPATPWILKAYECGWRYRLDKGFHRIETPFTLEDSTHD